jgi:hypothetical protein
MARPTPPLSPPNMGGDKGGVGENSPREERAQGVLPVAILQTGRWPCVAFLSCSYHQAVDPAAKKYPAEVNEIELSVVSCPN